MAGKNSHIGLQNSHASHYPVNDWGFVSSKHLMKMCQIYMSGIGSKALEIQVKATEAKRDASGEEAGAALLVWVIAAGSLRWPAATQAGLVTSAPPGQQVQTGGKAGGLRKVRGGIGSPKSGPSQPGLLGTCLLWHGCGGNLLGKCECVITWPRTSCKACWDRRSMKPLEEEEALGLNGGNLPSWEVGDWYRERSELSKWLWGTRTGSRKLLTSEIRRSD
ncbi:uncharacterized protein [Equus przewalskii]|uniref:Uncharacterized protein n=1 Tax=Equus przewalskii TaxID=9798 RepID=A0ABM2FCR4_EQUPR|nr:PREDICTED: uncharacterized protein LOC103562273 [Equus przewalskii]